MEAKRKQHGRLLNLFDEDRRAATEPVFTLKDLVQYIIIVVMMVVFYFTNIKDVEVRIAILETKLHSIEQTLYDIRKDQRELIDRLGRK
jgi:hypothetical protein